MLTRTTSRSSSPESSRFYRCPACDEMVDGHDVNELLEHHQHVLDPYRFLALRAQGIARARPTPKNNLTKAGTVRH